MRAPSASTSVSFENVTYAWDHGSYRRSSEFLPTLVHRTLERWIIIIKFINGQTRVHTPIIVLWFVLVRIASTGLSVKSTV